MKEKLGITEKQKKSIDDQLKEFNLMVSKKNQPLDDIRREIQTIEARRKLDKLLENE